MTKETLSLRPLAADDLETVVDVDRSNSGSSRRGFFEKRQRAAENDPTAYIGIVACSGERVVGFVLASILDGEFGGTARIAVLDTLGVVPDRQRAGVGHLLLQELISEVRRRGGQELQTQADWNQPGLTDFFSSVGFSLAPRLVLERSTEAI